MNVNFRKIDNCEICTSCFMLLPRFDLYKLFIVKYLICHMSLLRTNHN